MRFLKLSLLAAAASALPTVPVENDSAADDQRQPAISTTSGNIIGHTALWPENSGVDEYLGVPFAKPPLRELRFMPPQSFKAENVTIKADNYMDACMQVARGADALLPAIGPNLLKIATGMGAIPGRKYSEDCLGLNIWVKKASNETASANKPKAVLLWIYGGAFATGDTAAPFYNGARMAAEQDVIVVSAAYRVGFFGFPGVPGLKDKNLGVLDMRAAVEWTRDNIANFGGDPKRITIFGESAGAVMVDYYAYAWHQDPIVAGVISQSGSAYIGIGYASNNPVWWSASNALGCGGPEAGVDTVIRCMQGIPAELLIEVGFGGNSLAGIVTQFGLFGPIADNKVVFSSYRGRAKAGLIAQVPYLAGTTAREAGIISGLTFAALSDVALGEGTLAGVARTAQSLLDTIRTSTVANLIGDQIGNVLQGAVNCAERDAVEARNALRIPSWRYIFMGVFPNTDLYPGTGAYHASDVPYVFGTTERSADKMKNTPEQDKFINNVMRTWATFAKDPKKGLEGIGWKPWNAKADTLARLGYKNNPEVTFASSSEYDGICPLVSRIGVLTSISSGS